MPEPSVKSFERILLWIFIILLLCVAVIEGIRLRHGLFDATGTVRFRGDVGNALYQGRVVLASAESAEGAPPTVLQTFEAYRNRYDAVLAGDSHRRLDYPPLRLLVMTYWSRHVVEHRPDAEWPEDAEMKPLLWMNAGAEFLSASAVFALILIWCRRQRDALSVEVPMMVPAGRALIGFLLVWFNPASITNTHVWPQWDMVPMPFYLWSAVAASLGGWMWSGALIGIGALFKGQLILVAPVLVLWALFRGDWSGTVRWLLGFLLSAAIVTSPWSTIGDGSPIWLAGLAVAVGIKCLCKGRPWERTIGWPVVAGLTLWPWVEAPGHASVLGGLAIAALLMISVRRPFVWASMAAVIVLAMATACARFDGSVAWFLVGLMTGEGQYLRMHIGMTLNLPALLAHRYQWHLGEHVDGAAVWLLMWVLRFMLVGSVVAGGIWLARKALLRRYDPARWRETVGWFAALAIFGVAVFLRGPGWLEATGQIEQMTVQHWLRTIYFALLVWCGLALAVQSSRGSTRTLVALCVPWLVMFALLPQMHERYLLYGSVASALVAGYSLRLAGLCVMISVGGAMQMWISMINRDPNLVPGLLQLIGGVDPGGAYAVLTAVAVLVYVAFVPARARRVTPGAAAA